jgi:hypothetical protein
MSGVAGANRRARSMLRLNQLVLVAVMFAAVIAVPLALGMPELRRPELAWALVGLFVAVLAWKTWIFRQHLRAVRFGAQELVTFYAVQPVLDLAYAWGFARGLVQAAFGHARVREGGGSAPAS